MPNQDKIDLPTHAARKPGEQALQQPSGGSALEQHSSDAVSQVQSALNEAQHAISQSGAAANPQALEEARQQLTQAEEFLDQAQTSANTLNLSK